ncbi:MAG TPA: exonuclease SbcCD subunit D [Candidatus Caccovicinus merdipullorum]|uniref:Nuclease SbcCD subunit D n=1 Tax=Candidatus Caccovicinus merdipullorum TaxID=2840724 RepID=A0A9D1GJ31_9FIRM|nr:exonuclease SbcCD subunit D [Candidatus Caccovicinus merdipullorum]
MKLIHLSDLHIGKRVNEFSMAEDQKYILNQILEIIDREQPDCVVIAGDVYDKSIPSAEAVQILDDFLTRLAGRKIPTAMISGNHDSPERLSFGAQLMKESGIYVSPVYDGQVQSIGFADEYGEVRVYLLPFLKPATVRHVYEEETVESYQDAVETAISHLPLDTSCRNVLVAHQFAAGASRCESEEMSVGGIDQVDVSVFDDFDYVALGHIHSPQSAGRPAVRYCGTPLKYSFSEAGQQKSVSVVELFEKGRVEIREVPLTPLRDMRKIRGTYLELTARSFYQGTNTEDYIQAILTDEEDIPDGMQKLRIIYPNLMRLEYDNRRTRENRQIQQAADAEEKSETELFSQLYELQNNQPLDEEQKQFLEAAIRQVKGEE